MANHRKDDRAKEMYAYYLEGHSLAQVAKQFNTVRQSVYKMLASRNFKLRPKPEPLPFIEWNGAKYTERNNGYYAKTNGKRTSLHRDIWEHAHGPIPPGSDIHHEDGDRRNNDLSNLRLFGKAEHTRHHAKIRQRIDDEDRD